MGCEPWRIHTHDEPIAVKGRILCVSMKAVKLWTPSGDIWIPLSQILNDGPFIEGKEAIVEIPLWLARKKGLVE